MQHLYSLNNLNSLTAEMGNDHSIKLEVFNVTQPIDI